MLKTEISPTTGERRLALFSSQQLKWLEKAAKFADSVPLKDVLASDRENVFRRDLFEAACKEGFGALPFPADYGGSGGDYVSFCLVNEEFARRCLPVMSSLGVHVLCQEPVYRFGTEAQKKKYLPPSATGEYLAAFGLTEPNAGSDTAAIETRAEERGDEYLLNGTKTFITSGGSADYFIVMARLKDDTKSAIASFLVEKSFPGFAVGQKFDMLGMRGYATCEIVFNDCRVPKQNMLGARGEGRKVALSSLAKGRVTIAAQATGWAQGALEAGTSVLKERKSPVRADVVTQIGEMAVLIESARVLMYQAAASVDRGQSDAVLAGMAKVQATDAAMKVSTAVLSLLGSAGLNPELLVERIFRDAKAGQIYEGTNQIQRMLIARSMLK